LVWMSMGMIVGKTLEVKWDSSFMI